MNNIIGNSNATYLLRLPNWLGDVIMAMPVVDALAKQVGSNNITLLLQPQFLPLLEILNADLKCIALPKKGWSYYRKIYALRKHNYAVQILFTKSERADLEAFIIGAKHRLGCSGRKILLSDSYHLPPEHPFAHTHQSKIWHMFLSHFGLKQQLELAPFKIDYQTESNSNQELINGAKNNIGLICGTENFPAKRWSIDNWCSLIKLLLENTTVDNILLFGTANDAPITKQICQQLSAQPQAAKINNIAGKTNLPQFIYTLDKCQLVIGNDTGGIHLANALGKALIVLFGPTNPINTAPIYHGKSKVIQAANCKATGGGDIDTISPQQVLQQALPMLAPQLAKS